MALKKSRALLVLLLIIIAICVALFWPSPPGESVLRTADASTLRDTRSGPVIGSSDTDNSYAWLGIPFAAPPVGDLRWRAPIPGSAWDTTRDATQFGKICPQPPTFAQMTDQPLPETAEDCLFLNVWTPAKTSGDALPVMVWIHGGGLSVG